MIHLVIKTNFAQIFNSIKLIQINQNEKNYQIITHFCAVFML